MVGYGEPKFPYVWEEIKKLLKTKSSVAVTTKTTSGTNIADLNIDGTVYPIYAPSGGGGGTTDYADLTNKPKLEGVTLEGNKYLNSDGIHESLTNTEIEALINSVV